MNNRYKTEAFKTPFLTKPCPFCGDTHPQLQEYKYADFGMVVRCPQCWAITPVKMTWLSAVDAWENGEFSEETKMLSESKPINIDGALRLAEAVLEDAGNSYKWLYRKTLTAKSQRERDENAFKMARMEKTFFKGDSILKLLPIDGDNAIKTLRRQVEKEFEKKI
jgi:hypothetical protein